MAFPPGFLDEIRARVSVSDVVGRSVKLTKRGREHSGLCPFHNEKTPSFTVNDDKAFYHCFGCGAHGDVIKFMTEKHGLGFVEAVTQLAGEAGLEMPQQRASDRAAEQVARGLIDLMEDAAIWFQALLAGQPGAAARDYLDRRALRAQTIATFQLGFAPDGRQRLRQAMLAKGWTDGQLIETGLAILPEGGGEPYDRFRGRIMFPIRDMRGRCIAFGGRAMAADAKAKYLNSPETPLFHKGRTLYNVHQARKAAYDTGQLIIAEGYMDVIAMAQAGFAAAVAPLGTAVTEDQLMLLWRMADEPILCFDGDKAGLRAAARALDRALPQLKPGKSLRFAILPDGKDPDDLIKAEGAPAFAQLLDRAEPLAKMLWSFVASGKDISTPERRAALQRQAYDQVKQIADPTVRSHYESDVRERVRAAFKPRNTQRGGGYQFVNRKTTPRSDLNTSHLGRSDSDFPASALFEKVVVKTILNHPKLISTQLETLAELEIRQKDLQNALDAILSAYPTMEGLDSQAQKDNLLRRVPKPLVDELQRDIFLKTLSFTRPNVDTWQAEAGLGHTLMLHGRVLALLDESAEIEKSVVSQGEKAVAQFNALQAKLVEQNKELAAFDQQLSVSIA